jgi:hypothetical protein
VVEVVEDIEVIEVTSTTASITWTTSTASMTFTGDHHAPSLDARVRRYYRLHRSTERVFHR